MAKAKGKLTGRGTGKVGEEGPLISVAELRLRPVLDTTSSDETPLALEETGALGTVRIHVEGLGDYRLDVFVAPAGHDGASHGDLLYVEPWRVRAGGVDAADEGETPIGGAWISDAGEGESPEDPPSAAGFHFKPVQGFLLAHPTIAGKTYCPLPCWGELREAADFPPGMACPKCREWLLLGEDPPDPYAGARMEPVEEDSLGDEDWEDDGDADEGGDEDALEEV